MIKLKSFVFETLYLLLLCSQSSLNTIKKNFCKAISKIKTRNYLFDKVSSIYVNLFYCHKNAIKSLCFLHLLRETNSKFKCLPRAHQTKLDNFQNYQLFLGNLCSSTYIFYIICILNFIRETFFYFFDAYIKNILLSVNKCRPHFLHYFLIKRKNNKKVIFYLI